MLKGMRFVAARPLMPFHTSIPSPAASDDGDEVSFCGTCAFSSVCLNEGYDKTALRELQCLVEHIGPFQPDFEREAISDSMRACERSCAGMVVPAASPLPDLLH